MSNKYEIIPYEEVKKKEDAARKQCTFPSNATAAQIALKYNAVFGDSIRSEVERLVFQISNHTTGNLIAETLMNDDMPGDVFAVVYHLVVQKYPVVIKLTILHRYNIQATKTLPQDADAADHFLFPSFMSEKEQEAKLLAFHAWLFQKPQKAHVHGLFDIMTVLSVGFWIFALSLTLYLAILN